MIRHARAGILLAAIGLWLAPVFASASPVQQSESPSIELGDVMRGWRVFHTKRCAHCHALWGQGGQIGPDLGRSYGGHLSANELAGGMWNHVPRMLALMRQYRIPDITLTRAEMADVFSLLYFVRYLDEPGDPRVGQRVLEQKGCATCHEEELQEGDEGVGPALSRWSGFVNPIVWAQMMWEHSAGMAEVMKQRNMKWPELGDDDLANIIAFVRSSGAASKKVYLRPGSSITGRQLFTDRKCAVCHAKDSTAKVKGPDLARIELPRSLSALASRMWNHLPAMREVMAEQDIHVAPLTAQELADIIAYVFARQYEGEPGDSVRGRNVFVEKQCVRCHVLAALTPAATQRSSAIGMGQAIWQHGAEMSDRMAKAAIPWPTFAGTEMADLIAYIKTVGKITVRADLPQGAPPAAKADGGSD